MPIKLKIHDCHFTEKSVELPDKCPNCDADLHGDNAITSGEYRVSEQEATISSTDDTLIDDWGDINEFIDDSWFTVYWKCTKCKHVLVAGEESVTRRVAV